MRFTEQWSLMNYEKGKLRFRVTSMESFSLLTFSLALSWSNISWISCFQSSCREWKESLGISKKPDSSMAVRWSRILAKEGRECGSGFQQSRTEQRQATVQHLLVWSFERMSSTLLIPSGWQWHAQCYPFLPLSHWHGLSKDRIPAFMLRWHQTSLKIYLVSRFYCRNMPSEAEVY